MSITDVYPVFFDANGNPLDAGFIYIGESGFDAETNPQDVFFDAALTISASQPLRTLDGRVVKGDGTTASKIFTSGDYSITVKTSAGVLVSSALSADAETQDSPLVFNTASSVIADSTLTYTAGRPGTVASGDYIRTRSEGFVYQVAAASASDSDVMTSGGVRLYVMPTADGAYNAAAFGGFTSALLADKATNTDAINAAISKASGDGGGTVTLPAGTYYAENVALLSNVTIEGNETILLQDPATGLLNSDYPYIFAANIGTGGTTDPADNIKNIKVCGITFKRESRNAYTSATDPEQFAYLVSVSAVTDVLFEQCQFIGYQGDGLYVGSSNVAATERHNVNVTVRNCLFDGVDYRNRNGISVIDCDGFLAEGNTFRKSSDKTYMPGAIDIEPNSDTFAIIRNIKIINNTFDDCGGSNGSIGVLLPDVAYTQQPTDFLISGNTIVGGNGERGISFVHFGDATTTRDHDLKVIANTVSNTLRGIALQGVRNANVCKNSVTDAQESPLVGFSGSSKCIGITLEGNRFIRASAGSAGGSGLAVFDVDYLDINQNEFIDCGKSDGTLGNAISFQSGATTSYVSIIGNRIASPNAKTTFAISGSGHTFSPATNKFFENSVLISGNDFQSHDSDTLLQSYTPIVAGATTAGAGTYTRQYGRWRRIGKQVFVEGMIIQTGHTGSGIITISLPVAAQSAPNNELKLISCAVNGTSSVGGTYGFINPGRTLDSIDGAIEVYDTRTGSLGTPSFPAGAATYYFAGAYTAN